MKTFFITSFYVIYQFIIAKLYFINYAEFIIEDKIYVCKLYKGTFLEFLKTPGIKYVYKCDKDYIIGFII